MAPAKENFLALLKREGYSLTASRQRVFHALVGQEPLSMRQVVARVGGIDRSSVYRTVALFERLGIVQRLNTGWKYKLELSDKFTAHHHHLTCTNCGRTVPLSEQELERFIEAMARAHGFRPTAHQIEVQGLCQNCSTIDEANV